MLVGSWTNARSFMRPPQARHLSTVSPKVRRMSSAHLMYRHRVPPEAGAGTGALGEAVGGFCDAVFSSVVAAPSSSCGGGMSSGRQRLLEAKTPA